MVSKGKNKRGNGEYEILVTTALALLQRVDHYVTKCSEKVAKTAGITMGNQAVMTTIEAAGTPIKAIDLAQWIGKSKYAVSLIVDRMVKDGLVERLKDQPDRRSALLKVTPLGRAHLKQVVKPGWSLDKKLFSEFSEEEIATFIRLLRKIEKQTVTELKGKEQPLGDWTVQRVNELYKRLGAYE